MVLFKAANKRLATERRRQCSLYEEAIDRMRNARVVRAARRECEGSSNNAEFPRVSAAPPLPRRDASFSMMYNVHLDAACAMRELVAQMSSKIGLAWEALQCIVPASAPC